MDVLKELEAIMHKLPIEIQQDIINRLRDWKSIGGGDNHPYVEQQLRFAKNYIKRMEEKN